MNRWNYILVRLLQIVPTFFVIMFIVFLMVRLLPGDPASAILGDRATEEAVARINAADGAGQADPGAVRHLREEFLPGATGRLDQL